MCFIHTSFLVRRSCNQDTATPCVFPMWRAVKFLPVLIISNIAVLSRRTARPNGFSPHCSLMWDHSTNSGIPILPIAAWAAESSASVVELLMLHCLLLTALIGKLVLGPRRQQNAPDVQRRVSMHPVKSESENTVGVISCSGSPIQPINRQCFAALM